MKKIIIAVVIVLIVLGIGGLLFVNSKKLEVQIRDNVILELEDKAFNTDYIKVKNGEIITKKEVIDTKTIGKKIIEIVVKDFFSRENKYKYNVEVKDSIAPVIEANEKIEIFVGDSIDLLKGVKVTDNYDKDLKVEVIGEYDTKKKGEYSLNYLVKDSSGNETKKEFKLIVKEKPVEKKEEVVETPKKESTTTKKTETTKTETKKEVVSKPTTNKDGTFTTSKGFKGYTKNGVTYIDGYLIANKTYSLPSSFVPTGTHTKAKGSYKEICKTCLTNETYNAFVKLKDDALLNGFTISIASGYRSYGYQEGLYNGYVSKYGKADADLGSARPGHSEHQTGLGFDLNTISHSSGNTNVTKWVLNNCYKYGLILRYPSGKTNETGYKYEWWHLRYVGTDLAKKLYNDGNWITMENYFGITSKYQ